MLKFKNIFLIFAFIIATLGIRDIYSAVNDDDTCLIYGTKNSSIKAYNHMDPDELKKSSTKYEKLSDKLLYMVPCVGYPAYQLISKFYLGFDLDFFSSIAYSTGSVVGGVEVADLLSGVQHAFLDYMDDKNLKYPEILRIASSSYKAHHYDTKQVTRASYWLLTRHLYQQSLLVLPLVIYFNCYSSSTYTLILVNTAFLTFPQQQFIHACAHGKKISYSWMQKPIKWCQDHNLLLNWDSHKAHHNGKYEQNFCGITGHMNYFLNSLIKGIRYFSEWHSHLHS